MVRIRLRRTGKRHQPSYRVVVADLESPRDGRFIENIGIYNPRDKPPTIRIDAERARYWLSVGAQPSDAVARLLRKVGVLAAEAPAVEAPAAEAPAAEAPAAEAPGTEPAAAQAVAVDVQEEAPATEGTGEEAEDAAVAETEPVAEAEDAEAEAE